MPTWGGRRSQAIRAWWAGQLPLPCSRCGQPVQASHDWHVGHRIAKSVAPELQWDRDNTWPEHAACNLSAGSRIVMRVTPTSRRPL